MVSRANDENLRQQAYNLEKSLERIQGVDRVDTIGLRDPEIQVAIDPVKLQALKLTPGQVADTVALFFQDIAAGESRIGERDWLIRLVGSNADPASLANRPIIGSGGEVTIDEIANVTRAREKTDKMTRYNGKPAVLFAVFKQADNNTIELVDRLKAFINERNQLSQQTGVQLVLTDDQTTVTTNAINLMQRNQGIKLRLENAPAAAFVDGRMIQGIREHLFAVLRDIIYTHNEIQGDPTFDLTIGEHVTSAVFHILRNARVLRPNVDPSIVVCWGGHSIGREEYDYTKEVGYQFGLRGLDVCTGCGPGAMKGPMKGATIGHSKQRKKNGRYIGISEPGIIAAESPNPIVKELVIMPDIEKRLEGFVRLGHGIVVFPGGAGTAEEILYLLGVLLNPRNAEIPFPLVFTGPPGAAKPQAGRMTPRASVHRVPHQHHRHPALLGRVDQLLGAAAHLHDRARR